MHALIMHHNIRVDARVNARVDDASYYYTYTLMMHHDVRVDARVNARVDDALYYYTYA